MIQWHLQVLFSPSEHNIMKKRDSDCEHVDVDFACYLLDSKILANNVILPKVCQCECACVCVCMYDYPMRGGAVATRCHSSPFKRSHGLNMHMRVRLRVRVICLLVCVHDSWSCWK